MLLNGWMETKRFELSTFLNVSLNLNHDRDRKLKNILLWIQLVQQNIF